MMASSSSLLVWVGRYCRKTLYICEEYPGTKIPNNNKCHPNSTYVNDMMQSVMIMANVDMKGRNKALVNLKYILILYRLFSCTSCHHCQLSTSSVTAPFYIDR